MGQMMLLKLKEIWAIRIRLQMTKNTRRSCFARRDSLMPRAYSMDLRKRVMETCDQEETVAQVAKRFAVTPAFVEKLHQRRREIGTQEPKPHGERRQSLLFHDHDEMLCALLTVQPNPTRKRYGGSLGVKVHLSTLWYRLQRLGLTFKKTLLARRSPKNYLFRASLKERA